MSNQLLPGPWAVGTQKFSRDGVALEGDILRLHMPGALEVLIVGLGAPPEQVEAHARALAAFPELLALAEVGARRLWAEHLNLASKYAGTTWEADPAYLQTKKDAHDARALVQKVKG